jgi:hypothetical protein
MDVKPTLPQARAVAGQRQDHLRAGLQFHRHFSQAQHRRMPGEGVKGRVGLGVGGVVTVLLELDAQPSGFSRTCSGSWRQRS